MSEKTSTIKKDLTIKWILPDKQIIKFIEEAEDTYDLADNVIQYLKDIKEGDLVEVLIEKGTTNIVCVKKKSTQSSSPKNSVKEEKEKVANAEEAKQWTVKAITTKKDVVKFEEGEASWYIIPQDIRADFADIKAKDVIKVTIGTAEEKGKEKPAVISVEKVESATTTPETYTGSPSYSSSRISDTNNSIERQVCTKNATQIVQSLIEAGNSDVNSVNKIADVLKKLTKASLEAMYQ